MTIKFSCSCGKHISAPDTRAGKPAKCPRCGRPIVVPMPGSERAETLAGVRALLGVRRSGDTAELPPEEPENQLGRYPITGSLGKGGMGEVLLVEDPELGRDLAAKVIRGTGHADRRLLEKFLLEAKITGRLEHPNIVPVHELGTAPDGRVYFTMKRVRGKDLAAILGDLAKTHARAGPTNSDSGRLRAAGKASGAHKREASAAPDEFTLPRLLDTFLKVCDAVAFAHSEGIIHRDLKPANVMVGEFGEVQVMDWGLAKVVGETDPAAQALTPDLGRGKVAGKVLEPKGDEAEPLRTLDGSILGTPAYMPPEQAEGKVSEIDERSDIYSLGAILYEILTLAPPYSGKDARLILAKVVEGRLVAPSARAPARDVPRELEAVAGRAMAKDPARRYKSVRGLRADVEAFLAGKTLAAARYTPFQRAWKFAMRHKAASGVGAAAAMLLVFFIGWLIVERGRAIEKSIEAEEARHAEATAKELAFAKSREAERQAALAKERSEEAERQRLNAERHAVLATERGEEAERQATLAKEKGGEAERQVREAAIHMGDDLESKARLSIERKRTSSALVLLQAALMKRDCEVSRTFLVTLLKSAWRSRRLAGHEGEVLAVAFSPDGKRLASGSEDKLVRLWDPETGRAIATLNGHAGGVSSVTFSPDGKCLASGSSDGTVRLWEGQSGRAIATLEGHSKSVNSVAFSPDGKRLASGSSDGTVRFWDAETGRAIATLEGHGRMVTKVAFSPDGKRLASASGDHTVRLWDAETGRVIVTLEGHTGPVNSVAFSPDGKRLATGSDDKTIRLWDLETILAPPDQLKRIVEELTGMTLRGLEVVPKDE